MPGAGGGSGKTVYPASRACMDYARGNDAGFRTFCIRRSVKPDGRMEANMPARSKKQQMAAGAALAAKRGQRSSASLRGASRQMAESMSESQLREFAHTRRKGLPREKRG